MSSPSGIGIAAGRGAARRADSLVAAVVAMTLGAALLFAAGFAHSGLLHDAAHDSRHAFTFPCH